LATKRKIDFLYFDAGGGHRSAALALQGVIATQYPNWEVSLINVQHVLDPIDVFRKVTGMRAEDVYNKMLAKGWTLESEYLLPLMHGVIRIYHRSQVKLFKSFWATRNPDLVVSLIPNLNRALLQSLQSVWPKVPYVTIMTDMADYPPHFWIEKQSQYLICGTPRAAEQARELGQPASRVFSVSGMILRPQFYQQPAVDVRAERIKLGLNPDTPTALIMFGGEGSNAMKTIAKRLGNTRKVNVQMILLCGNNKKVRRRLEKLETRSKKIVDGFTQRVPYYMRLADFFIGKAGPGSISEAICMGLPVIVERNAWTLPQEMYNTRWVEEQGVGKAVRNFRNIQPVVRRLLAADQLAAMKQATARIQNRAVFEIPGILERLMELGPPAARTIR
jgi:Glycosyltransferase family 28 C-terminal domain/Monogalactosyldiacylglycerol (MGDG) synthase